MATNLAITPNELAARRERLSFEHRFFLTVAILFPLIIIIGFAPSYYFKTLTDAPPLPSPLVHLHGLTMSLWIVLYMTQTFLISAKRIRLHMTLGFASIAFAAVMIMVGLATGYASMHRGSAFPGYTPIEFFIIPVGDMLNFLVLFAAAIHQRRKPANHKRLMFVTVLNFLPPAIGRMPLPYLQEHSVLYFLGVPALIGLTVMAVDAYRNSKINRAFAFGMALLIISGPARIAISKTDAWTQFVTWLG